MKRNKKTSRQRKTREVYDFILEYKTINNGISPSLRDIVSYTGISLTNVSAIINRLEQDGMITTLKDKGKPLSRAIDIPSEIMENVIDYDYDEMTNDELLAHADEMQRLSDEARDRYNNLSRSRYYHDEANYLRNRVLNPHSTFGLNNAKQKLQYYAYLLSQDEHKNDGSVMKQADIWANIVNAMANADLVELKGIQVYG